MVQPYSRCGLSRAAESHGSNRFLGITPLRFLPAMPLEPTKCVTNRTGQLVHAQKIHGVEDAAWGKIQ
jgi:hypothetical protein